MEQRAVKQKTTDGKVIAIYPSIKDAVKAVNSDVSSICMACRGQRKTAAGYKWEYDNSNLKLKTHPLDKFLDFL
jgi:hypothetical protein